MKKLLVELDVIWSIAWDPRKWERMKTLGRSLKTAPGHETLAIGPILDDLPRSSRTFTFFCSSEKKSPERITCHFNEGGKPSGKAPKWVTEQNKRLGGKAGLFPEISGFKTPSAQIANVEIAASLSGKDGWLCRILHQDSSNDDEVVRNLGKECKTEQIGYRFEGGMLGMEEMSIFFDHTNNVYYLNIQATAPLQISPNLSFPIVDQILDFVVNTCFSKKKVRA